MKKILAIGLTVFSLSSCSLVSRDGRDNWFNSYYFQEGDFFISHIDGYSLNKDIAFDDCYFRVRRVASEEEQKIYDDFVLSEAPNSYWLGMSLPEYAVRQMDWRNCYFHEMPGFKYAYSDTSAIRFVPIEYTSDESPTAWRTTYAEVYDKTSSEYPIYLDIQLHKEGELTSAAKARFVIEGVCEFYMTFTFAYLY